MAVALSPPAPPTSLKRVNSDGTPTQAQLDYERAIAKWVADQINALGGGAIPLPTPTTIGGVKSLAAVSHKFLTSIGTDGLPVAAQPAAGDISGLGPFATASSIAVGSITGLGTLATLSSVDLASQATGNLAVSHFNSGIDASSSKFWRGDGIWAPVTASAGGSSGQIQFNSAGSLGGFTVAGDGTLDPVTGSLIVTKTNGVAFAAVATSGSASDLGTGTLPPARLPNPTLTTNGGVRQYNAVSHQYLTGISGFGVPFGQQPSVTDLQEGSTGNGAVVRAAGPTLTGSVVADLLSLNTLTANSAIINNTISVNTAAGGTSTGTIATFKDADSVNTRILVDSVGAVPVIDFRQARGTSAAPSASQLDDILGILAARGYGATGYNLTTASGAISFRAAENWTNTAQGSYFTFETTPNGSTTRAIRARINNDGKFGIGRTATTYILEAQGDIFATGSFRGDGSLLTGITASGFANQSANLVLAGPTTGAASTPTFRALVGADLPNPSATTLGGVQSKAAVASNWLTSISTSGVPVASQPAFTDISGTAAATQGGTGQTGYAVGDLLYASTTTALSKLADVATGNALISGGITTAPSWGKITTSHTTGIAASGANSDITSLNSVTRAITSGWSIDGSSATITLAAGASASFSTGSGLVNITDQSVTGCSAAYLVGGTGTVLLGQSIGSSFVVSAAPASGQVGLAWVGGGTNAYVLKNNQTSSSTFGIIGLRTRIST
jgi:hypothetical protein